MVHTTRKPPERVIGSRAAGTFPDQAWIQSGYFCTQAVQEFFETTLPWNVAGSGAPAGQFKMMLLFV